VEAVSRTLTFRHRFSGGITCEATANLDKLRDHEGGILRVERTAKASGHTGIPPLDSLGMATRS
jgi:hypothetical protein